MDALADTLVTVSEVLYETEKAAHDEPEITSVYFWNVETKTSTDPIPYSFLSVATAQLPVDEPLPHLRPAKGIPALIDPSGPMMTLPLPEVTCGTRHIKLVQRCKFA